MDGAGGTLTLAAQFQIAAKRVDRLLRFIQVIGVQGPQRKIDVGVGGINGQCLQHRSLGLLVLAFGLFACRANFSQADGRLPDSP